VTASSRRLYVTGEGAKLRGYVTDDRGDLASTLELREAQSLRTPNPDDLRTFWANAGLSALTNAQIAERYGVTRQAVHNWRAKAGIAEPTPQAQAREDRVERIIAALSPEKTSGEIAREVGTTAYTVRQVAREQGVVLRTMRRPSDLEIVALAEGRTWRELAEACGVAVHTLRHYVYKHPELSAQVCARVVRSPTGDAAHGKIDPERLATMHAAGMSAHAIANAFRVEIASVMYWVKKLNLRG
jgi:transposase